MNNDASVNHNNAGDIVEVENEDDDDIDDFLDELLGNPPPPPAPPPPPPNPCPVNFAASATGAIRGENDGTTMASAAAAAAEAAIAAKNLTYVNPKQFHRILKRRDERAKLEDLFQQRPQAEVVAGKPPYQHESRHNHAMKRPRGPGGRFLKKDELAAYYAQHPEKDPNNSAVTENDDPPPEEEEKPATKEK